MARPGHIKVRFQYSTDNGATWLPASPVDLWASEYSLTVPLETAIEQKFEQARRIRRVFKGRVTLSLTLSGENFGANDTNDVKLNFAEDWLRKPLLRIWTHNGAATPAGVNVEGRSYFASASNTNYVLPDPETEAEIISDFRKNFEMKLQMRDVVA